VGKYYNKSEAEEAMFERVGIVRQGKQDAEIMQQLNKDAAADTGKK